MVESVIIYRERTSCAGGLAGKLSHILFILDTDMKETGNHLLIFDIIILD